MMFSAKQVFPGITHITDCMGVSFTLMEGSDSALLFDAGYGLENTYAYISTLTDRPTELILSHGHHDHVLGARWFRHCRMSREDLEEFHLRTGTEQREAVCRQALEKGLFVPENYLTASIPEPEPLNWLSDLGGFECIGYDLGDLEGWLIHVPGHTPGSCVLYVPEYQLLLTGDDWNPCTWMWFPSAEPVQQWRANMQRLLGLLEEAADGPLETVLCSHQPEPRKGSELIEFLQAMTDEQLATAPPVVIHPGMYDGIDTHQVVLPEKGWTLVFDMKKFGSS